MSRASGRTTTHRSRWLRFALYALLIVVCGYSLITGWRIYRHVNRLRHRATRVVHLSPADIALVGPMLDETAQDLAGLQRNLALPLWLAGHAGWVPWIGPTLEATPVLFGAGVSLVDAANETYGVVEPWVNARLDQDADTLALGALMNTLIEHHAALDSQAQRARVAVEQIQAIKAEALVPRAGTLLVRAQAVVDLAPLGIEALVMAPDLIGIEPRTYLLLAQNNHELRATGGFISAIATLTLGYDTIKLTPFVDSYQVENWDAPHPDPPEPLRQHMSIDLWTTRDGNWWPDFPTSAQAVADLYTLNQGQSIDGVIAADLYAAQHLLEALTPLQLSSGRRVQAGEVDRLFRESWGLPAGSLLTDGVVITATQPFVAIEVGLQYPAIAGQVWFDAVELASLGQNESSVLANPSFELDQDQDGLPDQWTVEGVGSGDILTTSRAYEGQRSVGLVGDKERAQRLRQRIAVQGAAGSAWHVSAQSAAQGVPVGQDDYAIVVDFYGQDGAVEHHQLSFPAFTHDWATAGSAEILGDWWRHRKDIISEAMGAAMAKAMTQPGSVDWETVAVSTQAMLDQRHVQLAFFEPAPAAWMADYGWDGALRQTQSDFLMVVDSNVGFNKVTASIEHSLDYQVDFSTESPLATLTLIYTNTSRVDTTTCDKFTQYVPTYDLLTQGCYWNYIRIYVPSSVELVSPAGAQDPMSQTIESGYRVFARPLLVPPGESETIQLVYRLPAITECYGLNLQKQAGVAKMPARVVLLHPPPSMVDSAGIFSSSEHDALVWEDVLIQDQVLTLCGSE